MSLNYFKQSGSFWYLAFLFIDFLEKSIDILICWVFLKKN